MNGAVSSMSTSPSIPLLHGPRSRWWTPFRGAGPRGICCPIGTSFGTSYRQRVQHIGIEGVLIASRSPWQNPDVERLIGGIRRDRLDHVLVLHERHLRRLLARYFQYYHHWCTHRALAMDCPTP